MKTLINKRNPQIRITAPEITIEPAPFNSHQYVVYCISAIDAMYNPIDWTLVENGELSIEGLPWPNEEPKHTEVWVEGRTIFEQDANTFVNTIKPFQREHPSSNLDEVAEEYANKEHPDEPSVGQWGTGDYEPPIDREYLRELAKDAFKKGAKWQKKQAELTWRDLQKLDIIANKLWQDGKYDKNDAQEFYTEVLKRFKEYKEQKSK